MGGGGVSLKISLFWIKKAFGRVYIKPTYFPPLCSIFLQAPNFPSILYQYDVI